MPKFFIYIASDMIIANRDAVDFDWDRNPYIYWHLYLKA